MTTLNFDLLNDNVLTISEMFNVRGGDGDGDQGTTSTTATTTTQGSDIIL